MKIETAKLNLLFAWLWILLGFISGMILGMFFRGENWLGGYASFKRRLYRLAHVSFFGLGAVNLLFWLSMEKISGSELPTEAASWAFIIGGVTMPLCCVIMAHCRQAHLIFSVPVLSLLAGGILTLLLIYQSENNFPPALGPQPATHHTP